MKTAEKELPVIRKNEEYTIDIVDIGTDGEGIGKYQGYTLFVKGSVPGDKIRVRVVKAGRSYGYGRLMEIIEPSPYRIKPDCPVADRCGGCQLSYISYNEELNIKQKKAADCLTRLGGFPASDFEFADKSALDESRNIEETDKITFYKIIGSGGGMHYRNKAQLPVGLSKDGDIVYGFYAIHSHNIIPVEDCLIQNESCGPVMKNIKAWMEKNSLVPYDEEKSSGSVRHVLIRNGINTGQTMVVVISYSDISEYMNDLSDRLNGLADSLFLNINTSHGNRILGNKTLRIFGPEVITEKLGDITYRISPEAFFQVNTVQMKKLYDTVVKFADPEKTDIVYDLYCGTGSISLYIARKVKNVIGVEIVDESIKCARDNARLNHIENAEFYTGAAEEKVPEMYVRSGGTLRADTVIVDPPRKGCDRALLDTVLKMAPGKIIYVSCNPSTLARDLKVLCEKDYKLKAVQPCDLFSRSAHVETVALLGWKGEKQDYMYFDYEADHHIPRDGKASYREIKEWILKEYGLKVSSLYIAQIKSKCGMDKRENYNLPKGDGNKVPECPKEKEEAIIEAFKYFGLIE